MNNNLITGIGINVMDTVFEMSEFPKENEKVRVLSTLKSGGGMVGTGIVAAAKLGGECSYIGVFDRNATGDYLKQDFSFYGVDYSLCEDAQDCYVSVCCFAEQE